jgi:uncharacterized protein (DUF1697 family)
VGGQHRVEMARLRDLLTRLGHTDVRTLLQSGNAVFEAGTADAAAAGSELEDALEAEFGFACPVIVRTATQLDAAMTADPLLELMDNPSRHFVGFLSGPPAPAAVTKLHREDFGADRLQILKQHLYLWCPLGISNSPLGKLNFDRLLGSVVTVRNWNTVTKLADLAKT